MQPKVIAVAAAADARVPGLALLRPKRRSADLGSMGAGVAAMPEPFGANCAISGLL